MKRRTVLSALAGMSSSRPVAGGAANSPGAVTKHMLANGVTVLVREDHSSRIAAVSVQVQVGALHETRTTAGLRAFTQELLLRGTLTRPREALLDFVELHGAGLEADLTDDTVELWANGAGDDCAALVGLLGELITEPLFSVAEVEAVRTHQLLRLAQRDDDFLSALVETLQAQLHRGPEGEPTSYGLPKFGWPATVASFQRNDVVDFFRAHYVGPRVVVAITGAVATDATLRAATAAFAGLPSPAPPGRVSLEAPLAPLTAPRVAVIHSPAQQGWVALGFRVPGLAHDDYPALAVLATLLGRGFKSRLYHEFREQSALAYEVGAELTARAQTSDFLLYAQVEPLLVDEAKNRILSQLQRLRTESVPAAELERARRMTVGGFVLAHQRNRQRAFHLARFEAIGVGHAFDAEYPNQVRRVTADDLRRVVRAHFGPPAVVVALPEPTPPERGPRFR